MLNDCDIDCAGEPDDLQQKCFSVKELDLAQNKLQNWNEVFTILKNMPRVEFVNLSLNRLQGPVEPPFDCNMSRLRSLVLNNTRLDWESVETLINRLPSLEELHLSLNDYHNVLIDTLDDDVFYETHDEHDDEAADGSTVCSSCGVKTSEQNAKRSESLNKDILIGNAEHFLLSGESICSTYKKTNAHDGLKKLHFNGNPVSRWNEICRLGRVFPNLKSLVLAECPLK